jgi:tetratricopeptide (TPR) repeat protein
VTHVPESELALYASHPDAIREPRRTGIASHIALCAECQATHDFLAVQDDDLDGIADADAWEPLIGTATYESLMAYGARVAEEDREAEEILEDFFENPITAAWSTLKRRHRTGGVVRRLNAAAHAICESRPLVALTFADVASSVAESLPEDLYPALAVHQLRGTAWKERANAQMLLGQFTQAHESLDRAHRAYGKTPHNALGLSIVALVRAGVYYEQGLLDEALQTAQHAEVGFAHAGDTKRRMDAVFLRGIILFEAGNPKGALPLFHQLIEQGENAENRRLIALGSYAAASCELDLGNLPEASVLFHRALAIFRGNGPERERLLTEWGIARLLLRSGAVVQAMRRLRDVAAAFEERGMVTKSALVGLDLADALLSQNRPGEIVTLAQHLFSAFTHAGMLTGALTALAYLKEAAANGSLTADALREIRTFLRKAERQPSLRFVPPPIPSPKDSV